jgi:hypothetical protein
MVAFLQSVRERTGGGDGLLANLGVDPSVGAAVRRLLLEPA